MAGNVLDVKVQRVPLADLQTDPTNVRLHGRRNHDSIKASLAEFGQVRPLLVTADNVVLAGNGTLEGMRALGWTEADVIVLPWSDPETCRAYAIADNRTAELAIWDGDLLGSQVGDLAKVGVDVKAFGFDLPAATDLVPPAEGTAAGRPSYRCPSCGFRWQRGPEGEVIEL